MESENIVVVELDNVPLVQDDALEIVPLMQYVSFLYMSAVS